MSTLKPPDPVLDKAVADAVRDLNMAGLLLKRVIFDLGDLAASDACPTHPGAFHGMRVAAISQAESCLVLLKDMEHLCLRPPASSPKS